MSTQGSGRNGPRSKSGRDMSDLLPQSARLNQVSVGCSTCRRRKVKCGEEKPVCVRCLSLRLNCEWGVPVKRGRSTQIRHLKPAPRAPDEQRWAVPKEKDLVDLQPDALIPTPSPVSWVADSLLFDNFHPTPVSIPVYPALDVDIACANSLTLNSLDRQYFQYFPSSSLIHYYMKGWKWSSFW